MITGEIYISTTWNASTSFIPLNMGTWPAQDIRLGGIPNRGFFATTAYVSGIWESQRFEEDYKKYVGNAPGFKANPRSYGGILEQTSGMMSTMTGDGRAFSPGTVIQVKVRKIKALKASPNRSGVQFNRQLVKGQKVIFRYLGQGEIVRP